VNRRTARELTALADGTLAAQHRIAVLRRIAASPTLAQALAQQILAVEAIRRLDTRAPTQLRERSQRGTRDAFTTPATQPARETMAQLTPTLRTNRPPAIDDDRRSRVTPLHEAQPRSSRAADTAEVTYIDDSCFDSTKPPSSGHTAGR
jgi:hypothetical protein